VKKVVSIFLLFEFLFCQRIVNLTQIEKDGNIIITYDLLEKDSSEPRFYNITITAKHSDGTECTPTAFRSGELENVSPGKILRIEWDPIMDSQFSEPRGEWTITLTAFETQSSINQRYEDHKSLGDGCYDRKEWDPALRHYEAAQVINKNQDIDEKIETTKKEKKVEELLKNGEDYFNNQKWDLALLSYEEALRVKNNKKILDKIKQVNEEIRFDKYKTDGDHYFEKKEWYKAIDYYEKAKELLPKDNPKKIYFINEKIKDSNDKLNSWKSKQQTVKKENKRREQIFIEAEYDFLNSIGDYTGSCFFGSREISVNYMNELGELAIELPGLVKTYALNLPADELKKQNHAFIFGFSLIDNFMLSDQFLYFELFNILLGAVFWSDNYNNKLFINLSGNMPPLSGYMLLSDRSLNGKEITLNTLPSTGSNSSMVFPLKTKITFEKYIGSGRSFQLTVGKLWVFEKYNWYYKSDIEKLENDDLFELNPVNYFLDISKGFTFIGLGYRFSSGTKYNTKTGGYNFPPWYFD